MFKLHDKVVARNHIAMSDYDYIPGTIIKDELKIDTRRIQDLERELAAAKAGYHIYTVKFDKPYNAGLGDPITTQDVFDTSCLEARG